MASENIPWRKWQGMKSRMESAKFKGLQWLDGKRGIHYGRRNRTQPPSTGPGSIYQGQTSHLAIFAHWVGSSLGQLPKCYPHTVSFPSISGWPKILTLTLDRCLITLLQAFILIFCICCSVDFWKIIFKKNNKRLGAKIWGTSKEVILTNYTLEALVNTADITSFGEIAHCFKQWFNRKQGFFLLVTYFLSHVFDHFSYNNYFVILSLEDKKENSLFSHSWPKTVFCLFVFFF